MDMSSQQSVVTAKVSASNRNLKSSVIYVVFEIMRLDELP